MCHELLTEDWSNSDDFTRTDYLEYEGVDKVKVYIDYVSMQKLCRKSYDHLSHLCVQMLENRHRKPGWKNRSGKLALFWV